MQAGEAERARARVHVYVCACVCVHVHVCVCATHFLFSCSFSSPPLRSFIRCHVDVAAPAKQKLKFIYLANDVILQGRKKGPAYVAAFQPVLPKVLPAVFRSDF